MTICHFLSLVLALQSIAFAANPPRVIALMDESPIVVRLPNRTLGAWLVKASGEHDQVFEILSTDNGRTWALKNAGLLLDPRNQPFAWRLTLARDGTLR